MCYPRNTTIQNRSPHQHQHDQAYALTPPITSIHLSQPSPATEPPRPAAVRARICGPAETPRSTWSFCRWDPILARHGRRRREAEPAAGASKTD
ncbi:hypothetical protein BKA56DRAFT_603490 [Ilyonectria sp. MPI-CAGE-AT-0026]|nr:hypothetical protein BKA56DRAFT_603490 [Ilyonectria sp. MPI-CAGE-AT-0026]